MPLLLPRRHLLIAGAATGLPSILAQAQAPATITRDSARPGFPSGVQSGDVTGDRGIVWARCDRPARLWVEWATTASFAAPRRLRGPHALEVTDHSARIDLTGLPPGQDIFYRVQWEDSASGALSEPMAGHFRTAPAARSDVRFVWSGDTAGQGWGISEAFGGMKIYEAMRKLNPDFFLHSGDTIYADGPIQAEVKVGDDGVWKNLVTEEKSKVAETLKEFRGNYRYNQLDAHVRRFNSEVMQLWQWDDHEVTNNWSGSKDLSADARYSEKNVPLLTARATRAFLENAPMRWFAQQEEERVYRRIGWGPLLDVFVIDMRSYRGRNTHNRQERADADTPFLGAAQLEWLRDGLKRSRALWKVIAADMPLGLVVGDGKDAEGRARFEAVANGDGPALGRELEIAELLQFIKRERIRNTVWLTADVHYTAAHHYHPNRARFQDFEPFWEFVSGPLHAGSFGPNALDDTFGPKVEFVKAPPAGQVNLPPSAGLQFFGEVQIEARSGALTVQLRDLNGASLWQTTLKPQRA
ncbi:alkaline phosphatase D family protein [Aquincola sp. S2]|uniref:Alkaline phosphatase D family protein n=1 Tax=Pseudaquabacterium terrae TaxID=2732868 RepID=A0ABX2EIA7_9BURK|nr:alkaline phosphatase D family protein [Aquabacterium terrae]NRF68361.1 alkaline phosphatase D family protein [Aquabacterium terrae]